MKTKLILCLAFLLSGVLIGCSPQKPIEPAKDKNYLPKEAEGKSLPKKIKGKWTETPITLYRANGSKENLSAKKAIYEVQTSTNHVYETAVVAFVDSQTGTPWIGMVDGGGDGEILDFFIETDSGIVGVTKFAPSCLLWRETLIAKTTPGQTVDAVIDRFEREIDGWWLVGWGMADSPDESRERTEIQSRFQDWFFSPGVGSSQPATLTPVSIEMSRGTLRLEFKSPALGTTGTVWINPNTRKVVKASERK
jgi:hypothetical protein